MRIANELGIGALICFAVTLQGNAAFQQGSATGEKSSSLQCTPPVTGEIPTGISVPPLIRFSGSLSDALGKPLSGPLEINFAIYEEENDADPVWQETQTLQLDEHGHYTVLLGAMQPEGLPAELFTASKAHWLGVAVSGLPEQPRVPLVSVPYSLKANDANMLGGKPASAYMLAPSAPTSRANTLSPGRVPATPEAATPRKPTNRINPMVAGTGTQNFLPVWLDSSGTLGNSAIFQSGANIGIGTTNPSFPLDVAGGYARLINPSGPTQFAFTGVASSGRFGQDGAGIFLASDTPGAALRFLTNNGVLNEWMRISSMGLVGVGTPVPQAMLDVNNTLRAGGLTAGTNGVVFLGPDNLDTVHQVDNQAGSSMHFRLSRPSPDVSGGRDFLIAPYNYGESISYNGLIEFTSGGISIRNLPGSGNAGFFDIDNSTDAGSLFIRGDDQGPMVLSERYDGTSAGPITFGVVNSTDSFIFGQCTSNCNGTTKRANVTTGAQITARGDIRGYSLGATVSAPGALGPILTLTNSGGGAGSMSSVDFNTSATSTTGTYNPMSRIAASDDGNFSDSIVFAVNNPGALENGLVERMRITSGGNVGIGTSAPATALQVVGNVRVGTSSGNGCVQNFSGAAIAGICSSDSRLKESIQPFPRVLDNLVELQPVHFNWRVKQFPEYHFGPARNSGLIAQQVEKFFPSMVSTDSHGFKMVNYSELPYLLLEGERELKAQNDDLRGQIRVAHTKLMKLSRASEEKDAEIEAMRREIEQLRKTQEQMASELAHLGRTQGSYVIARR